MGSRSVAALIFACCTSVSACGGNASLGDPTDGVGGGSGDTSSGGSSGSLVDGGSGTSTGGASFDASDFVDPGCPDAAPPEPMFECDPFDPLQSCSHGLACYPYVFHPNDQTGCGQQRFGSVCATPGSGVQGDFCGDGFSRCAGGFLCVIGSKPGKRCVRVCPIDGSDTCPDGLICGETDIEGIGVCT